MSFQENWVPAGTFAWWVTFTIAATAAVVAALDLRSWLADLAATPAVTPVAVPVAAEPCPSQRTFDLASHAELERLVEEESSRAERAEALAHELRLRNDLLRQYLDRRAGEEQRAALEVERESPSRRDRRASRPRARLPIARTSTPKVQLIGSDALVTGTVSNPGPTDLGARVELELLVDGRRISSRRFDLRLPAGGTTPYSQRFPTSLGDGTYSARVFVEL